MNNLSPRTQWLALNRIANTYKVICFSLAGALVFSLCILAYVSALPPIVVSKDVNGIERYSSNRENIDLQNEEIKNFVKIFITRNYTWEKMNDPAHLINIRPFVTEDFLKLLSSNKNSNAKNLDGVSQYVGNIKVSVSDKEIIAQFDKIVRLKGLPLVSVTQISLQIIKDTPNKWNPVGLYVNGLIEHGDK